MPSTTSSDKTPTALLLLTGSTDSLLAGKLLQFQGIALQACYWQFPFSRSDSHAVSAAQQLQISLRIERPGQNYLDEVVSTPRFGRKQGMAPCFDCRLWLYRSAAKLLEELGLSFLVTGEVAGQRIGTQRKQDLEILEFHSGLQQKVVRPLSGQLLTPTSPEESGILYRTGFHRFYGNSRSPQQKLAKQLGLAVDYANTYASQCRLTDSPTSDRVKELLQIQRPLTPLIAGVLQLGRHFQSPQGTRVVVTRSREEHLALEDLMSRFPSDQALLQPHPLQKGPSIFIEDRRDPTAISLCETLRAKLS